MEKVEHRHSNYKNIKSFSFDSSEEQLPNNIVAPVYEEGYLQQQSESEIFELKSETYNLLAQLIFPSNNQVISNGYVKDFLNINYALDFIRNLSLSFKIKQGTVNSKKKQRPNNCVFILLMILIATSIALFVNQLPFLQYQSYFLISNHIFWGSIPDFIGRADYLRDQVALIPEKLPISHLVVQAPFCLVIPYLTTFREQQRVAQIQNSIKQLNYTNYEVATVEEVFDMVKQKDLNVKYSLNYFDYWLLINKKCSKESYVMFLAAPLQPNSLNYLQKKFRESGAWLLYSKQKAEERKKTASIAFNIVPEEIDQSIQLVQFVAFSFALYESIGLSDTLGNYTKYLITRHRRMTRETIVLALYQLTPRLQSVQLNKVYSKLEILPVTIEPNNFNEDNKYARLIQEQNEKVKPSSFLWLDFQSRTSSYTRMAFQTISAQKH